MAEATLTLTVTNARKLNGTVFIFFLQLGPVEENYLSVKDVNHIRQRSVGFRIYDLMAEINEWIWRAARTLTLGALLIGVSAVLIWTLEHTDIVAFSIVLLFSSLGVFALSRLLWAARRV